MSSIAATEKQTQNEVIAFLKPPWGIVFWVI